MCETCSACSLILRFDSLITADHMAPILHFCAVHSYVAALLEESRSIRVRCYCSRLVHRRRRHCWQRGGEGNDERDIHVMVRRQNLLQILISTASQHRNVIDRADLHHHDGIINTPLLDACIVLVLRAQTYL